MAESPFVELEVGSRTVKVTNPDKVFFRARGETKLDLVQYYLAVGEGIVRVLYERPTQLQAAPGRRRGRGDLPEARAEAPARLDRDRDRHLPLGPHRRRALRHRARAGRVGRQSRDDRLPSLAVAAARRRAPGRAPHRRRPAAGHRLRRGEAGRGNGAGRRSTSSASSAGRRRRATAASTSPAGSSRSGASARCGAAPSRSRARSSAARRSSSRPRGGRRSAASASSSTTTRTRATGRSPPPTPSAPGPTRPSRRRSAGRSSTASRPRTSRWRRCRAASPSSGDVQAGIDDAVCDLRKLFEWVEREEAEGAGEAPYPPNFPKMPGEPKRVQPSRARKGDK